MIITAPQVVFIKTLRHAGSGISRYFSFSSPSSFKKASTALFLARQYSTTEEPRRYSPPPPPYPPTIPPYSRFHPNLSSPATTSSTLDATGPSSTLDTTDPSSTYSSSSPESSSPTDPSSSTKPQTDPPTDPSAPTYPSLCIDPPSPTDPSPSSSSSSPSSPSPDPSSSIDLAPVSASSPNNYHEGGEPGDPKDKDGSKEPSEIKDPVIIFNTVWTKLEAKYGRDNLRYPQEIIWLGGAPGAGKGTNTPFIASVRGITAAPIVMSSLLDTPESRKIKSQGGLVSDSYPAKQLLILEELRKPIYRSGVVVDGFPRTTIQVECTNMLYEKMLSLRKQFFHTPLGTAFARPVFRVTVLFIEEMQSVERQLKRGKAIQDQNRKMMEKGLPLLEERDTDMNEDSGRKRYKIFRDHYSTLQTLKKHFPFTLINASGTIEEVQQNIIKEFKYQSSLELSQETYDMVQRIPLVSDVIMHARSDLVARLDEYQYRHSSLFELVIQVVEREFVPVIRRHSIAGIAFVRTTNTIFSSELAIEMVLDVLSERGYHVMSDIRTMTIPASLEKETGKIINMVHTEYQFQVRFQHPEIREIFDNAYILHMQMRK